MREVLPHTPWMICDPLEIRWVRLALNDKAASRSNMVYDNCQEDGSRHGAISETCRSGVGVGRETYHTPVPGNAVLPLLSTTIPLSRAI